VGFEWLEEGQSRGVFIEGSRTALEMGYPGWQTNTLASFFAFSQITVWLSLFPQGISIGTVLANSNVLMTDGKPAIP
jgi:hypothetical protein